MIRRRFLTVSALAVLALALHATAVGAAEVSSGKVPVITAAEFQADVMQSDLPVLVQFYAEWCPYCRATQPSLQELYRARMGALRVFKINTDNDPELAQQFKIESIPAFFLLDHGKIVAHAEKTLKDAALTEWVDAALAKIPSTPAL